MNDKANYENCSIIMRIKKYRFQGKGYNFNMLIHFMNAFLTTDAFLTASESTFASKESIMWVFQEISSYS